MPNTIRVPGLAARDVVRMFSLAAIVSIGLFTPGRAAPPSDTVVYDLDNPRWLFRANGSPVFICGPGDPEGFLYRGVLQPDGTRIGDQDALIQRMVGTGANCLYVMAVRSHGGDGDATENPFPENDPARGVNPAILDQWEGWFQALDEAGIVIYLFLYDDSANVWNTGDTVGAAENTFVRTIVNRFEHHANLIWCIAEEYSEALSPARTSALAAIVRDEDANSHPIAVHQRTGLVFDFPNDPNMDQFAVQYNVATAEALHEGMVTAWNHADGRYQINMTEAAGYGTGQEARRKSWACAMAGSYVMILGMDVASTPISDLEDCGRLVGFFESTGFSSMAPHDEWAYAGTDWILAAGSGESILYAGDLTGEMGRSDLSAGVYNLHWFDCATGVRVDQPGVAVAGGQASWPKPAGLGAEIALHLVPESLTAIESISWAGVKARYRIP